MNTEKNNKILSNIVEVFYQELKSYDVNAFMDEKKKYIYITEDFPWLDDDYKLIDLRNGINILIEQFDKHPDNKTNHLNVPNLYTISFRFDDMFFYEKVWLKLSIQAEKDKFINLFKDYIGNKHEAEFKFVEFQDNEFINIAIRETLKNKKRNYYYNFLESVLTWHEKNSNFKLQEKTLDIICRTNKYTLRKIETQKILKNFVEEHFPEQKEKFRKYWPKVDTEKLVDKEVCFEMAAISVNYDKVYLHNLNPKNPEEATCLRRLRNLVNYLNKPQVKKMLGLEKTLLDAGGSQKDSYSFIFITNQSNVAHKESLKKIIIKIAELENCNEESNIQKVVNYVVLENKITNEEKPNKSKKNKL